MNLDYEEIDEGEKDLALAEINDGQIPIAEEPLAYNGCDSGCDEEGDDIAEEVNPTLFLERMTVAIGDLEGGAAAIAGSSVGGGCSQSHKGGVVSGAAIGCSSYFGGAVVRAQFNKRLKETIRTWRSSVIF